LHAAGVGTGIHYPIPVHLQNAYRDFNYKVGDFPVTEKVAEQVLSLPIYAGLRADQQSRVAETIMEFASVHSI
jgi:dTDP-4-amino-4,6-dideoxygalactose transaminase